MNAKWVYSDKVKDHFMNPRNLMREEDESGFDGIGHTGNIKCGDEMMVYIKVDPANLTNDLSRYELPNQHIHQILILKDQLYWHLFVNL